MTFFNFIIGMRSNKDPYSSKGPSIERTYGSQSYEGRGGGSRSGSQHRSRDSSIASQRNIPSSQPIPVKMPSPVAPVSVPPAAPELSDEALERRLKNMLEEYLNDLCAISISFEDIKDAISTSSGQLLVSTWWVFV